MKFILNVTKCVSMFNNKNILALVAERKTRLLLLAWLFSFCLKLTHQNTEISSHKNDCARSKQSSLCIVSRRFIIVTEHYQDIHRFN